MVSQDLTVSLDRKDHLDRPATPVRMEAPERPVRTESKDRRDRREEKARATIAHHRVPLRDIKPNEATFKICVTALCVNLTFLRFSNARIKASQSALETGA